MTLRPFAMRRGAVGLAMAGCAAWILASCAYYSADIETVDADGQTVSMDVTVIQGPWAMLKRGDLATLAKVDSDGAWETRAGGTQEGVDNATGINAALDILGELASDLAPYVSQYLAAREAVQLAEKHLAERIAATPAPTPIPSSSIEPLELPPGAHEPAGEPSS